MPPLLSALALLAACRAVSPADSADAADSADTADSADSADTADSADSAPLDRDSDGYTEDVDCDDTDPRISPAATEAWNGLDDDCDGLVDADGAYTGQVAVAASAVYQGVRRDYTLTCPFVGTRAAGTLDYAVTCTPDPADDVAQLLLGATLVVTPYRTEVVDTAWSGTAIFTSANGWDSRGEATLTWSDVHTAALTITLSSASLAVQGAGTVARP